MSSIIRPFDRDALRDLVRKAQPFPHFSIDNFLEEDCSTAQLDGTSGRGDIRERFGNAGRIGDAETKKRAALDARRVDGVTGIILDMGIERR